MRGFEEYNDMIHQIHVATSANIISNMEEDIQRTLGIGIDIDSYYPFDFNTNQNVVETMGCNNLRRSLNVIGGRTRHNCNITA